MTNLTWTSTKPTVPGWYWWRFTPQSRPVVRNFEWHADGLKLLDDGGRWWDMICGEWAGPLEPPKEEV